MLLRTLDHNHVALCSHYMGLSQADSVDSFDLLKYFVFGDYVDYSFVLHGGQMYGVGWLDTVL